VSSPEFGKFAARYEDLLKDPIRVRFTSGESIVFHTRKRELILRYLRSRNLDPGGMKYLDFGCGQGELLGLLGDSFAESCGCDPSPEMMAQIRGRETRVQQDPLSIPYEDGHFDFITAVCVYHHIPIKDRPRLTAEVRRVLRPGGIFCIIEHNPLNPVTRIIVSRTPVDADAILLPLGSTRSLMKSAGLEVHKTEFFLYVPEGLYKTFGRVEKFLRTVPLGGQYAVFAQRPECGR
jgi:SAM-dependent methyltransferase